MTSQLSVVWGAARYEYRMQIRRVSLWVVLGLMSLIVFGIWYGQSDLLYGFYTSAAPGQPSHFVPPDPHMSILFWARLVAMLLPLGVGLMLADRLVRDSRLRVDELFDAVEASMSGRFTGKFLGGTAATLTPVFLVYFGLVAYVVAVARTLTVLPFALALFAAMVLPGSLFVAGFSITLPVILRVPVYQFLFTGYWFWANLLPPRVGIPTIIGTMLNAAGPWAMEGIFNVQWAFLTLHATALEGFLSIALLSGLGLAACLGMVGYLHWRARER